MNEFESGMDDLTLAAEEYEMNRADEEMMAAEEREWKALLARLHSTAGEA